MIRIAAFGDCHVGADTCGRLRRHLEPVNEHADVVLIAGDLTKCGTKDEARLLTDELRDLTVPVYAVLGNHDYHSDEVDGVERTLTDAGIHVLDGDAETLALDGVSLGIAGTKGFGGGFAGASGSEFGEPEMKAFMVHTKRIASGLQDALVSLTTDYRVALLHYAPIDTTLEGERLEIYPFLGSYLLAGRSMSPAPTSRAARPRARRLRTRVHAGRCPGAQRRATRARCGLQGVHPRHVAATSGRYSTRQTGNSARVPSETKEPSVSERKNTPGTAEKARKCRRRPRPRCRSTTSSTTSVELESMVSSTPLASRTSVDPSARTADQGAR